MKDPAFLFYSNDFDQGTKFFSDEQTGKYIRLLICQHQHGHLTQDQVLFICKSYDNHIMSKFTKDDNGLWFNERLENEIIKRKNYSESRSKNKKGKNICKSYDEHMENENENKDLDNKKGVENDAICFYDADLLYKEFENSQEWKNGILMQCSHRDKKLTDTQLTNYLIEFVREQKLNNTINRSFGDLKRHFYNWLTKKLDSVKK